MNKRLLLLAACLLNGSVSVAYAEDATTQPTLEQRIEKIERRQARMGRFWKKNHAEGAHTIGMPVTSSPYIGIRPEYTGQELVVNASVMNQDLFLLEREQTAENFMKHYNLNFGNHPVVLLSGKLEAISYWMKNYDDRTTGDIDLTAVELDLASHINPWASGFFSFKYDNAYPASGSRVNNSNVSVDRAFITLGNLNRAPLYGSVGQMYVPFGHYSSRLIGDPVTKSLGRTKVRALLVGVKHPYNYPVYASVYAFRGHTRHEDSGMVSNNFENDYGANVEYKAQHYGIDTHIGFSYMRNLADSNGMQFNGATNDFKGFGQLTTTQGLEKQVGAGDVFGRISYGPYAIMAEYTAALEHFDSADMTFNSQAAKPNAVHGELDYNFAMFDRPASLAFGYDHTQEALALNMPRSSVAATASVSIWKDTIEGVELRQDRNYSTTDTATGAGSAFSPPANSLGEKRRIASVFVGFYF